MCYVWSCCFGGQLLHHSSFILLLRVKFISNVTVTVVTKAALLYAFVRPLRR